MKTLSFLIILLLLSLLLSCKKTNQSLNCLSLLISLSRYRKRFVSAVWKLPVNMRRQKSLNPIHFYYCHLFVILEKRKFHVFPCLTAIESGQIVQSDPTAFLSILIEFLGLKSAVTVHLVIIDLFWTQLLIFTEMIPFFLRAPQMIL